MIWWSDLVIHCTTMPQRGSCYKWGQGILDVIQDPDPTESGNQSNSTHSIPKCFNCYKLILQCNQFLKFYWCLTRRAYHKNAIHRFTFSVTCCLFLRWASHPDQSVEGIHHTSLFIRFLPIGLFPIKAKKGIVKSVSNWQERQFHSLTQTPILQK